ncbi:MAG: hypothetical protein AAF616_08270 [Bacteroidota bacterium]
MKVKVYIFRLCKITIPALFILFSNCKVQADSTKQVSQFFTTEEYSKTKNQTFDHLLLLKEPHGSLGEKFMVLDNLENKILLQNVISHGSVKWFSDSKIIITEILGVSDINNDFKKMKTIDIFTLKEQEIVDFRKREER